MAEATLSDMIKRLLDDPETGGKIEELVKSLGSADTVSLPEESGLPDIQKLLKFKTLLDDASGEPDPKSALFAALRPYLSAERCRTLDAMIRFLRTYRIIIRAKETGLLKELF